MNKQYDIGDDEIRVIGGDGGNGRNKLPWWTWLLLGIAAIVIIVVIALHHKPQHGTPGDTDTNAASETLAVDIWLDNIDEALPSCIVATDTVIDSLHLRILTPYNAIPELHVGQLDTTDPDIILAAMAADLRRDNGKIVGAFVYAGEPLSWGLSKRGYCAIIDGRVTVGTADNSPLFEQATEQGGHFFRQYPAVDNGKPVKNNPENASFRRALCNLDGTLCLVVCTDRVLMNDFNATLAKLGVDEAILLVGGTSDGWYRTPDGTLTRLGSSYSKNKKFINHIVFRKQ